MTIVQLTHIGICVSDLARSRRFYCEGLGFRERSELEVSGEAAATLLELPEVELQAVYLERDGVVIELLHYRVPGASGPRTPRPMNQPGLTHLSLRVDDLDATARALAALGAHSMPTTRTYNERFQAGAIFLTDPDGTRLELVERGRT